MFIVITVFKLILLHEFARSWFIFVLCLEMIDVDVLSQRCVKLISDKLPDVYNRIPRTWLTLR